LGQLWDVRGVVLIIRPFGGVVADVSAYAVEVVFPADDVFVIVSLPDRRARFVSDGVDSFGRGRFEGADNRAQGRWLDSPRL